MHWMETIFITATGTDIGKTYIAANLISELKNAGKNVLALKPVITGWDGNGNSDTHLLLKSSGLEASEQNINNCSPWRFKAPLSADMAAALENREINFAEVLEFCRRPFPGIKIIEGAGGVMSPVNRQKTFLDLVKNIECSVLLVTGTYLGAISHTLTALQLLNNLPVSIIINESENSTVTAEATKASIANFFKGRISIELRKPT